MNQDRKDLSQWLKANKLSLNVKKTELIIFHPKKTKLDYSVKFKLNGKILNPISTVKYFGILLDEHLLLTKQVNWVKSKLNQTNGILRYNMSLPILKIVYHSLFGSHLQYGAQLWGKGNCVNRNNIQKLQNRALRKITFNSMILLIPFYKDLKILKVKDLLHIQNCLLVSQIEQYQTLAKSFVTLKHYGDNHNYLTRASTKRILDTPLYKTNTYGTHSAKYHCIVDWNQFKRIFPKLSETDYTYSKLKLLTKRYFLN